MGVSSSSSSSSKSSSGSTSNKSSSTPSSVVIGGVSYSGNMTAGQIIDAQRAGPASQNTSSGGGSSSSSSTPSSNTIMIGGVAYPSTMTAGQILDIQRATGQQSIQGLSIKPQGTTTINQSTGTLTYTPTQPTTMNLKPVNNNIDVSGMQNALAGYTALSSGIAQSLYPSLYYQQQVDIKNKQLTLDFQTNPTAYPTTSKTLPSGEIEYTLDSNYLQSMQKQYLAEAKQTYSTTTPTAFKILGTGTEISVGAIKGTEAVVVGIGNFQKNFALQFAGGGMLSEDTIKNKPIGFSSSIGQTQSQVLQSKTDLPYSNFYKNMPTLTTTSKVSQFVPAVAGLSYLGYGGYKTFQTYKGMGLTSSESLGQTSITMAEGISPLKFGTDATDIAQITRASNYFNKKNIDITTTGTRFISGNKAIDVYGKTITSPTGSSYELAGLTESKLISNKVYFQSGTSASALTVPTTSGRIYTFSSQSFAGTQGVLLPTYNGLTPSLAKSGSITSININTMSLNGQTIKMNADIFPSGLTQKFSNLGGATRQITGSSNKFVLSKSGGLIGTNTKVSITGPLDTMEFDYSKTTSMLFQNTGTTLLKIQSLSNVGSSLGTGTRSSGRYTPPSSSSSSSQIQVPKVTAVKSTTIPKVSQVPTQVLGTSQIQVPKVTGGFAVSALSLTGLSATLKTESLLSEKLTTKTKQIPTINTYTIPFINSAYKTKVTTITSSSTATIPKVIQIPDIVSPVNPFPSGPTPTGMYPAFVVPVPFIPPFSTGMIGGASKLGKIKTKAKYGYTPSFTALAFSIKGKQTKPKYGKKFTGLELRKIPKGWNIFKAMKGMK